MSFYSKLFLAVVMLENFVQGQTECACCKYQCIISHRYARVSFMLILVLSQLKL